MKLFQKNRKLACIWAILSMVLLSTAGYAQERKVSGKIISADDNLPIPGASVSVKGRTKGTSSDANGQYVISAQTGDILVFKSIGFQAQEKTVADESTINITLKAEASSLNEVVVIGYGVQKKKLTTGANLQVKGEDLLKQSTTNALQALQGKAPGVQISSTSGQPGEGMRVIVRGLGTIGNSGPLYVVDGVQTGDISYINPADIESIDVLKDAASAAIYGSQSANGVILVTTKTGKNNQKAQFSFDGYSGVQNVATKARLLNAREYASIMNEAAVNSGKALLFSEDGLELLGAGTNWMDQMFVKDARTDNYNLSATGGNAGSIYSASLSYTNQEGIVGGKSLSHYERYNFRVNTEHKLYKDLFKVGQHLTFTYIKNNGIGVGNQYNNTLRGAFNTSPFVPMYDEAGNFYDNSGSDWNPGEANPYAEMYYNNQNRNNKQQLLGDVYMVVEPVKNLRFRTSLGVDYGANEGRSFLPLFKLSAYSFNDSTTRVTQSLYKGTTLQWDNTLSYSFKLQQKHFIEVLAGTSAIRNSGSGLNASNRGLAFNDLDHAYLNNATNKDGANISLGGSPYDPDRRMSYFGRVSYNLRETYLLNATLRADGSSKFGPNNRYGYFPSVSAGWVATNESFLQNTRSWLDFLKLRASWGQVGNQNIGYFQYLSPVKVNNTNYNFGTEGNLAAGAFPERLSNLNVKWETSEQVDFGFDARFLNGKASFNFDYYIKNTKDWLILAPILATAGADAPYVNGGNVKNRGVELDLSYRSKIGQLNYTLGINGSFNKNKVGVIPTNDGTIHGLTNLLYANSPEFYRAQNGLPIGYFWGYKTAGIFQTVDEVKAYKSSSGALIQPSAAPGDVRFVDINNDGQIGEADKTMIGNPNPDVVYGFNISADYKGFDLQIQASGVAGNDLVQSYRNHAENKANYLEDILSRWHGAGSSNTMPRVTEDNRNWLQFSDLYIKKGDFLRISTVTLGYDFSKLVKKNYLSKVRLYASALNLFTFTKYNGMDPEVGYTAGDGTTNTAFASGVDLGYYPRPRTFLLGANIKF